MKHIHLYRALTELPVAAVMALSAVGCGSFGEGLMMGMTGSANAWNAAPAANARSTAPAANAWSAGSAWSATPSFYGAPASGNLDYLLDPNYAAAQVSGAAGPTTVFSTDPCVNAAVGVANSTLRLMQEGVYVGGSSSSPASSSESSSSARRCTFCNGTGQVLKELSIPNFGNPQKKHCDICGREYWNDAPHAHLQCRHCGGSGTAR